MTDLVLIILAALIAVQAIVIVLLAKDRENYRNIILDWYKADVEHYSEWERR